MSDPDPPEIVPSWLASASFAASAPSESIKPVPDTENRPDAAVLSGHASSSGTKRPAEDDAAVDCTDAPGGSRPLPPALRARLLARGILKEDVGSSGSSASAGPQTAATPAHASAPAAAAAPQIPAARTVSTAGLPPGWYETLDTSYKTPYYFNPHTSECSWSRPPGSTATEAGTKPAVLQPLPAGWRERCDPISGVVYYYHFQCSVSQWERPWLASEHPQPRPVQSPSPAPSFVPSSSFAGTRPGYVFGAGEQGVGYYQDLKAAPPAAGQLGGRGIGGGYGGVGARGRGRGRSGRDRAEGLLDPMDPSSYSDAPRGGWSAGLGKEIPTGSVPQSELM